MTSPAKPRMSHAEMIDLYRGCAIDVVAVKKNQWGIRATPMDRKRPAFITAKFTHIDQAMTAVEHVIAVLRTKDRQCITCGRDFRSSGPGHRMCGPCRETATSPLEPYALTMRSR
jgi:hypothetical protein